MVIARSGAALAACVVLACSALGGVCCAELALEKSDGHNTFRLFYSVRKLTWSQARVLCNLSNVEQEAAVVDAANTISSSMLLELTRRQRPQFESAWVVSSRRGGDDCLEVVATCDQSIESPVGLAGCATKKLSVVAFKQMGCLKRTKNAVICHQEHRRPTLSTESTLSPAGKATAGKQDTRIEGNEGKPAVSNAHGMPTQAPRVGVTSPIATMLAIATTTDRRSRAYNHAGSDTTVAQSAMGNRILWATSAFFKGLEKGEKAMLGLILGSIGGVFVICSVAVILFCIHPKQGRGKKDAHSSGRDSSIGTEEEFPLLPVADRQADASAAPAGSGSIAVVEHVVASAAAPATVSDVEAGAARAAADAVGPAGSSSDPQDGRSQAAPATAADWHRAADAAVPPNRSSLTPPEDVNLRRRSAAGETAETLMPSNVTAAWRPGGEQTAAAPTGRTTVGRAARRTEQTLSVVHDLSESSEEDEQPCQLPPSFDVHRPPEAAVAAVTAVAAAAAAAAAHGSSSTSSASGYSRFVSAAETHSTNSSGRSRSSSTASSDTWWPPVDFVAASSAAGDSYMNSSGIMVTAL